MARLLLLAVCEKAITDLDNTVSLMRLVEEVTVQVPAGVTPLPNAGIPMQWSIVAVFEQEPGDQNKTFEQYTAFVSSSNDILFQSPIAAFELKTDKHRITTQVNGNARWPRREASYQVLRPRKGKDRLDRTW